MGLTNINEKVTSSNPLQKEHIGVVIDIDDSKNICRVRVTIPNILDKNNQVWFSRIAPNFPGVTYATPRLGQKIRVWFKDNSLTSGVYGLDYVHKSSGLNLFQPGDYGFADLNSNMWRVRGSATDYRTGILNVTTNKMNVSGKFSCGNGYTGSFSTGDGKIVNVENGIITDIVGE